jgi:hypothetical protein
LLSAEAAGRAPLPGYDVTSPANVSKTST